MVKLDLQLFGTKKVNDAVVNDVIRGKYGNGDARKTALANAGYDYKEVQAAVNTKLKGGSSNTSATPKPSTKPATKPASTQTNTPATTTNNPTFKGVDQKYVDMAHQEYKPSEKENEYGAKRDKYVQGAEDKINAGYQPSEMVTQAFDYIDDALAYFQNGRTSWDDKINSQISAIENREKFVYDVDNDPLFQQALASAMNSGKTAMQDTIGQASALTGGYGSTYATSVGNQAYNSFIEDAYANLPQYYQMALSAYQAEGEEMYNLLGIYTQMGEQEWGRKFDAYNTTFDFANSQRDFEYGMYQDEVTNFINMAGTYDSMYQGEQTKNMALWQQSIENAWNTIGQQSSDYQFEQNYNQTESWNQKNFDEGVRQFNYSIGDTNNDGVVSDAEKADMNTAYSYGSDGSVVKGTKEDDSNVAYTYDGDGNRVAVDVESIPKDVSAKAGKFKDDDEALMDYLDEQVRLGNITENQSYYLYDYNTATSNSGSNKTPTDITTWTSDDWKNATFTKVKNTINWFGGDDNDKVIVNNNVYSINDVRTMMEKSGVDKETRNLIYKKLAKLKTDEKYTFNNIK